MLTLNGIPFSDTFVSLNTNHTSNDNPNIGISQFAWLYATNQLTLCQAVNGFKTYLIAQNMYVKHVTNGQVFEFLGHRLHPEDKAAIEIGYDGSVDKWMEAGNLPRGWYGLFMHNYAWYNPESEICIQQTTEPETKTIVPVSGDNQHPEGIVPIMMAPTKVRLLKTKTI